MKKIMMLLLIGTCIWQTAKADFGNCVRYEAKFYLKDGRVFKGVIECSGEGDMSYLGEDGYNAYCSDEGMMELLRKIQSRGYFWNAEDGGIQTPDDFTRIAVYKELEEIAIKGMPHTRGSFDDEAIYGFVETDEIVYVDTAPLERVVFWEARYAQRHWVTSEVLVGPKDMLTTIRDHQYWNRITVDLEALEDSLRFTNEWPMWGVELINYNENNNVAELKRLANLKFKDLADWKKMEAKVIEKYAVDNSGEDHQMINRIVEEGRERYFQELREWFWERGVLIVQVWGTC